MKFPQLVPERVCKTPCKVYRTDGLNRDGSKKQAVIGGRTYKIYGSEKAKDPDGRVNYTRLELI